MALNEAPNLNNDLIEPMEDLRIKSKDLLLSLGIFLKRASFYFGILAAPLVIFFTVFQFEIFSYVLDKKNIYNSSIIIGLLTLFLGYWLYKSALFANKPNENMKEVIGDNLISLITLSLLLYDLIVTFYKYESSYGLTLEQFHSVKILIITFVLLDFGLGLKASYYYYIQNKQEDDDDEEIEIEVEVEVEQEQEQEIEEVVKEEQEIEEDNEEEVQSKKDRFYKKIVLIGSLIIIVILVVFIMYGTSR